MTAQPDIDSRFQELIRQGLNELTGVGWDGRDYRSGKHPKNSVHVHLLTAGLNLVKRVCGSDSDHYQQLARISENERQSQNSHYLPLC